ncbi:hypothetical protein R3P38DRAFT_3212925 [Favolaschia claudopus]|uniref:RNase H type-1 domain-containing protein n=1 Tax=Favolaschia claudopus TaxID=2862362 RepID=A0AAW0ADG9_9AGAR
MVDSALPCSRRIGLEFDLPKFQLIHFVSPRRHKTHYTPLPLKIGDIVIQPTETAKLLGVMLDFKLSFRSHVELAQSRGTKATLALSRISTPTFGLPHSYMRQLFQTVVVPRMEYGLPALGKVQRQACKLITGALRTTATDTLDFHANVLPVHIRLNRSAYNAATRLASLPSSNPIRHTFRRCRRVPRFHRSPIHQLIHAFPIFRSDFETIDPQRRLVPLPAASVSVHIAATKDIARADLDRVLARGGTCIFTDGSGFEDGAGAAAVVAAGRGEGIRRQKHLGSMSEHTVFESEVCGAILALDIIADIPRLTDVDIFRDCQPAIVALSSPKPQPGQYLLAAFHAVLARILRTRRTLKIRLRWVPAHVGIAGNELVDSLAKEAAQGTTTPLRTRIILFESPLPTSRAAAAAVGAKAFARQGAEEWKTSPRHTRVASLDTANPSNAISRLYKELSRPQCSVLTQLRTGHIGLNAYLFRFHLAPSPMCPRCAVPESVHTFSSPAPPTTPNGSAPVFASAPPASPSVVSSPPNTTRTQSSPSCETLVDSPLTPYNPVYSTYFVTSSPLDSLIHISRLYSRHEPIHIYTLSHRHTQ